MESQRLMAVFEVEKWIKDLEKIEGEVTSTSRIHSHCLSVKFKSGSSYKLGISKTESCRTPDMDLMGGMKPDAY